MSNRADNIDEFSEDTLEKPVAPASERSAYGLTQLTDPLTKIIKKISPKYGFVSADIITDWADIAGAEVAAIATPVKISFPVGRRDGGTLYITLANSSMAGLLQYQFPKIVDRVNTYFGYNAISGVKIKR